MTIDEAISQEIMFSKEDWHKRKEYHEQLAEWLEELKANRIALEKANGYLETNYKLGYNKAIDDCKELTFREVVYYDSLNDRTEFRELAEQLKVGNSNGS